MHDWITVARLRRSAGVPLLLLNPAQFRQCWSMVCAHCAILQRRASARPSQEKIRPWLQKRSAASSPVALALTPLARKSRKPASSFQLTRYPSAEQKAAWQANIAHRPANHAKPRSAREMTCQHPKTRCRYEVQLCLVRMTKRRSHLSGGQKIPHLGAWISRQAP